MAVSGRRRVAAVDLVLALHRPRLLEADALKTRSDDRCKRVRLAVDGDRQRRGVTFDADGDGKRGRRRLTECE
jgi:hypothetical protein